MFFCNNKMSKNLKKESVNEILSCKALVYNKQEIRYTATIEMQNQEV